jgi:hypothetical protein
MSVDEGRSAASDPEQLRLIGEEVLGLSFGDDARTGAEQNLAGVRSPQALFSARLDSRTFFAQNERFGADRPDGVFDGDDDELVELAVRIVEQLGLPVDEIAGRSAVTEQTQAAQVEDGTVVEVEEAQAGKRFARLTRQVQGLPVWSSNVLIGLTALATVGFLQLHWPQIPEDVVARAAKLASTARQGFTPPELVGAKVESVEAGILHSPALGFLMEFQAAIRVVYAPEDETVGRKPVLHLDERGAEIVLPRAFEVDEEPPPTGRPEQRGLRVDRTRGQFRELLLANLNYFGNLPNTQLQPQMEIVLDTSFEQLMCIGYEPTLCRLEAVVYVKRETGFGGDICSAGTPEYVRFFLSFDGGATWQDQGMVSTRVYDVPGTKPLEFGVTLVIDPPRRFCFAENLPLVRGILSWNNPPPPGDAGFTPIWGNVMDSHIQVAPRNFFSLGDLLSEIDVILPKKFGSSVDASTQLPTASPKPTPVAELQRTYAGAGVPGHRFAYPLIAELLASPAALIQTTNAKSGFGSPLVDLGVDLADVISALLDTEGDTTFEELDCVGLDTNESTLAGTLTVKLANGYSGGLCSTGSFEYVAFFIDAGGGFRYVGTTSVNVHDLSSIPPDGVKYAVVLPVDFTEFREPCEAGAVTLRVRAILSWGVQPPPDPNFVPVWGNREETVVLVPPGPVVGTDQVPFISAVGDIAESAIAPTGTATGTTIHTGFQASDSPFGGRITLAGHISNPSPGLLYRIMRKPAGAPDSSYVPLVNEPAGLVLTIDTWTPALGWQQTSTTVHSDPLGYYPFEDYSPNHAVEGDIVGVWFSTVGDDGQAFDLRMDLSTDGDPAHDVHSNVVTVLVDNTAPEVSLAIDLGGAAQCADFTAGVTFTGTFSATDVHFGRFAFELEPSGPPNDPPHGVLPSPATDASIRYGGTVTDPGLGSATYMLDTGANLGPPPTGPMDACGYALILHVWDRTIVNSGGGSHHSQASVGFCLRT